MKIVIVSMPTMCKFVNRPKFVNKSTICKYDSKETVLWLNVLYKNKIGM